MAGARNSMPLPPGRSRGVGRTDEDPDGPGMVVGTGWDRVVVHDRAGPVADRTAP
jgi:hypothetical protein